MFQADGNGRPTPVYIPVVAATDAELIRRARWDAEALAELYLRYRDELYAWFRSRVPEAAASELTAELFAQVALSLGRFRDEAGGSAGPWLYGIGKNLLRRYYEKGRVEEAVPLLTESTRILLELGDRGFLGANLGRLARVLALSGHAETAAELVSRGEAMHAEIGVDPWLVTFNDETRALIRARLDEPAYAAACERGRALAPEAAVARALETLESATNRTRAGTG